MALTVKQQWPGPGLKHSNMHIRDYPNPDGWGLLNLPAAHGKRRNRKRLQGNRRGMKRNTKEYERNTKGIRQEY